MQMPNTCDQAYRDSQFEYQVFWACHSTELEILATSTQNFLSGKNLIEYRRANSQDLEASTCSNKYLLTPTHLKIIPYKQLDSANPFLLSDSHNPFHRTTFRIEPVTRTLSSSDYSSAIESLQDEPFHTINKHITTTNTTTLNMFYNTYFLEIKKM